LWIYAEKSLLKKKNGVITEARALYVQRSSVAFWKNAFCLSRMEMRLTRPNNLMAAGALWRRPSITCLRTSRKEIYLRMGFAIKENSMNMPLTCHLPDAPES
jgi:hypothetical protein